MKCFLYLSRFCHSYKEWRGGLYIQDNEKCTSEKVLVDIGEPLHQPRFDSTLTEDDIPARLVTWSLTRR